LVAYCRGLETARALAGAVGIDGHYAAGWHATSTIGTVAAAAAAARLLRLGGEATQHGLGMAASMAGGSRQNFGTMTKPLHAGLAARDAVLVTQLAASGFTADQHQLEAPLGYFQLYGVDPHPSRVVDALQRPHVLLERGLNVKKYPCCYGTHRMADAALALRRRGVRSDNVRAISVTVEPG